MRTVKFKGGDTILTEGEQGDTAFLIVDGSVEVTIGEGAKAKNVGVLKSGEVFGEMSLIDPGPRSATVRAVIDTECVVTNYEEFNDSIQTDPARAALFMKTLVRRLRQMNEKMAEMDPHKRGPSRALPRVAEDDAAERERPAGDDLLVHDVLSRLSFRSGGRGVEACAIAAATSVAAIIPATMPITSGPKPGSAPEQRRGVRRQPAAGEHARQHRDDRRRRRGEARCRPARRALAPRWPR